MSHKLLPTDPLVPQKKGKLRMPNFAGKFGFSFFIGKKEIFIGVSIGEVEVEQIIRKRFLKAPQKGKIKVFNFD